MNAKQNWDTELYEARHSFVWQMGQEVLDLLAAKPGEHILDLGCGTGQLCQKIANAGALVVGVDASPEMIGQARQNYPALQFSLQDARTLSLQQDFDAVFSNATLHWIPEAQKVADSVARILKTGGRFVAELGGKGNIRTIQSTIRRVLGRHMQTIPESPMYFPSVSEYTSLLEAHGFEVRLAQLFDRPTALEGPAGMENWIHQFKSFYFEDMDRATRALTIKEIVEELGPTLWREGRWYADYRRLRIVAVKV